MKTHRNRSADGATGSQLLGFDDSSSAVRMARRELAERAWRSENLADAIDARKASAPHAVPLRNLSGETL